jgi:hypothetical protein
MGRGGKTGGFVCGNYSSCFCDRWMGGSLLNISTLSSLLSLCLCLLACACELLVLSDMYWRLVADNPTDCVLLVPDDDTY